MDLYTLSDTFLADQPVDEYVSAIWTERYTSAGDFQLVLAQNQANLDLLPEGRFLALRGSPEVMIVETLELENNTIKVSGSSLVSFLNQRFLWSANPASSAADERIANRVSKTLKPGEFISDLVNRYAIAPTAFTGSYVDANLNWDLEDVEGLTLGAIDASGVVQMLEAQIGPLYDSIAALADKYKVGISMYLESADPEEGYSIKFKTYQGRDLTSDQTTFPLVRLVPEMDSISNLKEIRSNALFKNVVYVYYNGKISKHLAEPLLPEPEGWQRRVLITDAEGAPKPTGKLQSDWRMGNYNPAPYVTPEDDAAFRAQTAADALANHNYIRAIDGETSPISEYKFGTHYLLGDVIELEGVTGTLTKARVTEYIRSQDQNGEREYPTISVVT